MDIPTTAISTNIVILNEIIEKLAELSGLRGIVRVYTHIFFLLTSAETTSPETDSSFLNRRVFLTPEADKGTSVTGMKQTFPV